MYQFYYPFSVEKHVPTVLNGVIKEIQSLCTGLKKTLQLFIKNHFRI